MVRARGSYPRCPGFKSLHRHHFSPIGAIRCVRCVRCACDRRAPPRLRTHAPVAPIAPVAPDRTYGHLRLDPPHDPSLRTAPAGSRVAVALSGGADSVALAAGAARDRRARVSCRRRGPSEPPAARRGSRCATRRSAATCARSSSVPTRRRARRRQAAPPGTAFRSNTPPTPRATSSFDRARVRLGASVVAVAHTKDDQAETFLLRLLRGAGPRGLSGMHPRSGIVVRPLLETPRAERARVSRRSWRPVPRRCVQRGCGDSAQSHPPRAAAAARSRFAPDIVDVLDREAAIAREDAEYLDDVGARGGGSGSSRGLRAAWSSTRPRSSRSRRRSPAGSIRLAQQMATW